jgi:hypothetical protein
VRPSAHPATDPAQHTTNATAPGAKIGGHWIDGLGDASEGPEVETRRA